MCFYFFFIFSFQFLLFLYLHVPTFPSSSAAAPCVSIISISPFSFFSVSPLELFSATFFTSFCPCCCHTMCSVSIMQSAPPSHPPLLALLPSAANCLQIFMQPLVLEQKLKFSNLRKHDGSKQCKMKSSRIKIYF